MSVSSGTEVCMRKAISYCAMRVSISGSSCCASCSRFMACRASGLLAAGLQIGHRGIVIDGLGVHGPDETKIASNPGGVRHEFADPCTGGAVLGEWKHGGGDGQGFLAAGHAGEALGAADGIG